MSKLNNSERQCHHPLCAGIRRKHIQSLWPVSDARMITPALEWALTKHSCGSHLVMCCSCCGAALGSGEVTQNVWGNPSYFLSRTGYCKAQAKVTRRQNKALESRIPIGNYIYWSL